MVSLNSLTAVLLTCTCFIMQAFRGHSFVDVAEKDVTVFVIVPTEVPLTVPSGESFHQAASDFCEKNQLDKQMAVNLTKALEMKYEQIKVSSEPLLAVGVKIASKTGETSSESAEQTEVSLSLYEGDTVFDAVYRFCKQQRLDIYEHGKTLEQIVMESIQSLTASMAEAGMTVAEGTTADNLDSQEQPSGSVPMGVSQTLERKTPPVVELTTKAESAEGENEPAQGEEKEGAANQTRFKLFSLPVKIDDKEMELDFYNGDHLNGKITEFCDTHNLNQTVARQPLIDAVLNYTQAIQKKYPDSVWLESI